MRKAVSCQQSHRFFTRCHCPVSRLSHTAFLPPFWMTISGKHVTNDGERKTSWWRRTKGVILNECEGSVTVVRKAVSCHRHNRFFAPFHISIYLFLIKHFYNCSEWHFTERWTFSVFYQLISGFRQSSKASANELSRQSLEDERIGTPSLQPSRFPNSFSKFTQQKTPP